MGWIKLRVVALESTADWCDEIIEEAGRIWELRIYDAHTGTHLCEATPSHALYFVDYVSERRLSDELDAEVRDVLQTGDDPVYMSVYNVRQLPGEDLPPKIRYKQAEYYQVMDGLQESYIASPPWVSALDPLIEHEFEEEEDKPDYRKPKDLGFGSGEIPVEDEWFRGEDHLRFEHRANLAAAEVGPGFPEKFTFKGGLFTAAPQEDGGIEIDVLRDPLHPSEMDERQLAMEV